MQEPRLDVDDIQGNILAGFNKDFQMLVGLKIDNVTMAKQWLLAIRDSISTTVEVLQFNRLFSAMRKRVGRDPHGLASTWLNVAFSHGGIAKLTSTAEADSIPDDAFRHGMPARSGTLGDPADPSHSESPYHYSNWKVGGPDAIPDILLIIASDRPELADEAVAHALQATGASGLAQVYRELGSTRSDQPGHEHFGFKDGISQPAVRGTVSGAPDDYLTPRLIDPSDPHAASFAQPGRPLVMPGQFVLGYDGQNLETGAIQPADPLLAPWLKNGSFLVFRRLKQDVAAFRSFVKDAERSLKPLLPEMRAEHIAAAFVGRWPNGEPLVRAKNGPDPEMTGPIAANAFVYANPMPTIKLAPGVPPDATPPAPNDYDGYICPHWAHIRKVNPRDEVTNLGDEFDTRTRLMIRRGIPYGKSLPLEAQDDQEDRGLLFLSYQASIVDSFEKITSDWVNQKFTPSPYGHDPIIGQTGSNGRTRVVHFKKDHEEVPLKINQEWVHPTGGGYFFAPSLSAIVGKLAK
ncbi:Dyp-type peroxidase [Mycetohabitans endofungorum]|uniref:Dyp-type peroxidase n=1 Tax=Mycetohabitans endofungorum TaxID=417203 RepID=UPI002B052982|nr:Dyp-type peroxidase [Mycetohabitans endofungorum]